MQKYSKEFKDNIIARMLPPSSVPVPQLAIETGVPKDTLYGWRLAASRNGSKIEHDLQGGKNTLSGEEKLAVVLETASLNEHDLGQYCRQKGFYPHEIAAWRENCIQANLPYRPHADRQQARKQTKIIKELQSELARKDKALAETAALLVLQKKTQLLWADPEDEK